MTRARLLCYNQGGLVCMAAGKGDGCVKRALEILKNLAVLVVVFAAAIGISLYLSQIFDDNNPFAVPVFILAVAVTSCFTGGYVYGILAALLGVVCVNYMFTYPFFQFNFSLSGYPLTFAVMLLVSLIISTLTTQIKKQEQLRFDVEKEKMRANLLRAVSHDIRTPLASIMGASSAILENDALPPENRRELLQQINMDARWLTRLTENLLSVTKFSSGSVALEKTDEVLEEILGSAIVKFRRSCQELPVSVNKPDEILLVPMDATLIEQVLINLFENVVMHAQTASQIWVTVQAQTDRVRILVEDDGAGIPRSILPRIFEGYASVDTRSQTDDRRNMGIGLAVCNTIIRAHGGGMEAYNNERGGATFSFWLPMEEGTQ